MSKQALCEQTKSLLAPIGTVTIPATTKRFVATGNRLRGDTGTETRFLVFFFGADFEYCFLGKVEKKISQVTLVCNQLRKATTDTQIIAELGGRRKSETTLTELYALMERQPNGEDGIMLTNGKGNIFYIRDKYRILRAVIAYCSSFCEDVRWMVAASSITNPIEWCKGDNVFSRCSIV
jgi:hypothetical protein